MSSTEDPKPARPENSDQESGELDIHSAAVVDENGNEIPITQEMIERACEALDGDAADSNSDDH